MNMIKVLLVIEVRLIANIFAEVLEDEPDFMIVGRSEDAEGALKLIQEQKTDVALVSVGLPEDGALKLAISTPEGLTSLSTLWVAPSLPLVSMP